MTYNDHWQADLEDMVRAEMREEWDKVRQASTCCDCQFCEVPYQLPFDKARKAVIEAAGADVPPQFPTAVAAAIGALRMATCWCTDMRDFVDGTEPARECEEFQPC